MKKSRLISLLALVLVFVLALSACGGSAATTTPSPTAAAPTAAAPAAVPSTDAAPTADAAPPAAAPSDDGTVYELKLSSSQVTGTWLAVLIDDYAQSVSDATGGRVKITVYHDNTLGAPPDLWSMMTSGGLEILNMGIAQAGVFPITNIVQTPFLLTTPNTAGEVMWTLYEEGMLPEFSDNMHVLTFLPTDMQMVALVSKEVTDVSDFKGLKIRGNSGQILAAIESLGGTAVSITTTEVYLSLSQGVIDAAISSPSAMTAFMYQDVCEYLLNVPISTGMNYIGMNLDNWNSLPSDLQDTLDRVSREFYDNYMEINNAKQQESIDVMAAGGMTIIEPSETLVDQMKSASSGLLDNLAADLNSQGYDGDGIVAKVKDIVANSEYEK